MKLFEVFPETLKKQVTKGSSSKVEQLDFAFVRVKKLPLMSRRNILSAMQHFFNVKGVTDQERVLAYKKIVESAEKLKICTMGFIEQCKGLSLDKSVLD